ncbi:glycine cleavage system aminomethyltransferase GcvT [Microbacterium sp. SSM24]|uniref:glycine cleavage system aminomethyltransferase GcvT n=1 Tax=Microbacterium sp. SSM24 TaxID=2991714 RepID=UPI002225F82B|nr:glycine cleavage system aminomethyltransferase GcvT [Microbacterium sp. SSM24]MCW3491745.1 glycine cleavage system aminomethyltransferase GcvT [Microbacterium sp. SSM24]
MTDPRTTPLHERHTALGASFTDFGGWSMPVRYSSDLAEHHAVRTAAGIFDISHMAEFFVDGPDAGAFLDYALAGRLSTLVDDQAKYSLVLDADGGIVDDVIVYRYREDRLMVVANAGNREAVAEALAERALSFDVEVDDATERIALIAVQGPVSQAILEATPEIGDLAAPLDALRYYRMTHARFTAPGEDPVAIDIGRTGYTGEDGFELYVPAASAAAVWDALLRAGEPLGLVPAGLASRDTLRLEAGMPLYGHELSRDIVPAQAGLGRVVAVDKEDFIGRAGLSAVVAADAPVLVGLVSDGKRAGRAGYAVLHGDDVVGEVTSGALSPTLGHPIAMAFVSPSAAEPGAVLHLDVRGTRIPATVTALPFYRRAK